jgi:hypothetical protein
MRKGERVVGLKPKALVGLPGVVVRLDHECGVMFYCVQFDNGDYAEMTYTSIMPEIEYDMKHMANTYEVD